MRIPTTGGTASPPPQKSERKTIVNTNWGGVTEHNSFGTHEFMELCRQLDGYLCGSGGYASVCGRVLTAQPGAHNTFNAPNAAVPKELEKIGLNGDHLTLTLPAGSVAAIELRP